MYEAFEALPEEKRQQIIRAAVEVFAKHEYKRASTDDIAAKAGISKGALFYYFKNKRELYSYLIHYAEKVLTQQAVDQRFWAITDFFELLEYTSIQKIAVFEDNPYWMDFCVRAFYSVREDVSDLMSGLTNDYMAHMMERFFRQIDGSKFKEGVSPAEIMKMLIWLTDGYMHQRQIMGLPVTVEELLPEYRKWQGMLRQVAYKEEFQ